MHLFSPERGFHPLATRFGWALLHSLWQGATVAILLSVGLHALKRHSAAARHTACLAALGLLTVWTGLTLLRTGGGTVQVPTELRSAQTSTVPEMAQSGVTMARGVVGSFSNQKPARVANGGSERSGAFELAPWWNERLEAVLPMLVVAWAAGVLLLSLRHAGGWWRVKALRNGGEHTAAAVGRVFAELRGRFGLSAGAVRLLESTAAGIPMLTGLLRPVVLLPARAATGLNAAQLEAVLAHELAHLVRRDLWTNLALVGIETLFFYHPAVWWIGRRAREAREIAADDLALGVCQDRREYARALARLAEYTQPTSTLALAGTGLGSGSLLHRIRHILQPQASAPSVWGLTLPPTLLILAVALVWIGNGWTTAWAQAVQSGGAIRAAESHLTQESKETLGSTATPMPTATPDAAATPANAAPAVTAQEVEDVRVARLLTTNRQAARIRAAQDRAIYTPEQLQAIETLYQVANNKGLHDTDARVSLKQLLDKYDRANRTGCATLYYGQGSRGAERLEYLTRAVEKFSDCYYFDGCQVGGYGRAVLAMTLWDDGQKDKARTVLAELRTTYKDATDHRGRPMSEAADAIAKGFDAVHP